LSSHKCLSCIFVQSLYFLFYIRVCQVLRSIWSLLVLNTSHYKLVWHLLFLCPRKIGGPCFEFHPLFLYLIFCRNFVTEKDKCVCRLAHWDISSIFKYVEKKPDINCNTLNLNAWTQTYSKLE
jgi:hypothetical protein